MLATLEKLGVLRATHPALSWPYEAGRMAPRDDAPLSAQERRDAYLAVMGAEFATQPDEAEAAARSLRLPAREIKVVSGAAQLVSIWQRLGDPGLKPSEIAALLRPIDVAALEAVARIEDLSGDSAVWKTLHDYLNRIRHVRTELGGDYLREMNVPEGPIYRRILGELLAAKLNGVVTTREDEEHFVKDRLRRTAIDGAPARDGHEEGASQA